MFAGSVGKRGVITFKTCGGLAVVIFYALSFQGRGHLDRWNGIVELVIRSNIMPFV